MAEKINQSQTGNSKKKNDASRKNATTEATMEGLIQVLQNLNARITKLENHETKKNKTLQSKQTGSPRKSNEL